MSLKCGPNVHMTSIELTLTHFLVGKNVSVLSSWSTNLSQDISEEPGPRLSSLEAWIKRLQDAQAKGRADICLGSSYGLKVNVKRQVPQKVFTSETFPLVNRTSPL